MDDGDKTFLAECPWGVSRHIVTMFESAPCTHSHVLLAAQREGSALPHKILWCARKLHLLWQNVIVDQVEALEVVNEQYADMLAWFVQVIMKIIQHLNERSVWWSYRAPRHIT